MPHSPAAVPCCNAQARPFHAPPRASRLTRCGSPLEVRHLVMWAGLQHARLLTIPPVLVRPGGITPPPPRTQVHLPPSLALGAVAGQIIPWNFPILMAVGGPGWLCRPCLELRMSCTAGLLTRQSKHLLRPPSLKLPAHCSAAHRPAACLPILPGRAGRLHPPRRPAAPLCSRQARQGLPVWPSSRRSTNEWRERLQACAHQAAPLEVVKSESGRCPALLPPLSSLLPAGVSVYPPHRPAPGRAGDGGRGAARRAQRPHRCILLLLWCCPDLG